MNLLGGLQQLIGRAGNTVHNDVVSPLQRLTGGNKPNASFTPAPVQHLDFKNQHWQQGLQPHTNELAGQQVFNQANKTLQFTPAFATNVSNALPYVGQPQQTTSLNNQNGAAAEYLGNYIPNQIVLGQKYAQPDKIGNQQILLHEGLHRVWQNSPNERQQFTKAYDKAASTNPALRAYLQMRVSPYASARGLMDEGGVYKNDFSKLESLPTDLQNEVHSYIPQGYFNSKELGQPLTNYYKQYYNPDAASSYADTTRRMFGALYGYDAGAAKRDPRASMIKLMAQQKAK